MLTPDQIRRRALNRYEDFLRSFCTGESFFPFAVFGAGLSKPNDFAIDRSSIDVLRKHSKEQNSFGYTITWEERNFRKLGAQNIPREVFFDSNDDYVRFIGKVAEVRQFRADYDLICHRCPDLILWGREKPLKIVAHSGSWDGLLSVCLYLKENPRPNCYLRELPVVVDTKFVERHTGILTELLPIVAPATVGTDDSRFETRFGFRFKQPLVRFRFLDASLAAYLGFPVLDLAVPLDDFRTLPFNNHDILIVENEMTFLTLPELSRVIAVFGSGDAAALLNSVEWLSTCRLLYWGDLDLDGFETLYHLREKFPHTVSILMDNTSLGAHRSFCGGSSCTPSKANLNLTPAEQVVYSGLAATNERLEQERISPAFAEAELKKIFRAF
jgi:hypothetical protein